jgi:nucleoside 2-deoxyribosyltransferase
MRVYVASKLENIENAARIVKALQWAAHEVTYDWTTHGPVWGQGKERIEEVAGLELNGVTTADVVICLLPGGRGTHVELGAAVGRNIPVILHSVDEVMFQEGRTICAFYLHAPVTRMVCSYDDLAAQIINNEIDILA